MSGRNSFGCIELICIGFFLGLATVVIAALLLVVDLCIPNRLSDPVAAIVVARQYVPANSSIGTGVTSKGSTVVTSDSTPESWYVVVKTAEKIIPVKVTPEQWAAIQPEQTVKIRQWKTQILRMENGWEIEP